MGFLDWADDFNRHPPEWMVRLWPRLETLA